jgi:fructokinase
LNVTFISETGNDRVGRTILDFLKDNGVNNENVCDYLDGRTPISLAWLNDNNDAEYEFYKDYPNARLDVIWPRIERNDIVIMGSYFVLNPVLRSKVLEFLNYAKEREAIIYYDFNFRDNHKGEAMKLYPDILENLEFADIVRGSTEDIANMFGDNDPDRVYQKEIDFYCKNMICTDGSKKVRLISPQITKDYNVKAIKTVSTIGAGDNFNAGIVYGLITEKITKENVNNMTEEQWDRIIKCSIDFSSHVCQSLNNSISKEYAENYIGKKQQPRLFD